MTPRCKDCNLPMEWVRASFWQCLKEGCSLCGKILLKRKRKVAK